jgi:sigma-B regulation protein RsbU (phosphoserine phosphatase)
MANRIYSETLHALGRKTEPGTLLRELHHFVHTRIPVDGFFFTMAAARFSKDGRRVGFSAAGQPPAILVSNGTLRRLESRNGILGCLPETTPSEPSTEVDLSPGNRLILYTDGLVEVFNGVDEMLGVEGLEELVLQSATLPLAQIQKTILDGVAAWRHGPLADDVSLVIAEVSFVRPLRPPRSSRDLRSGSPGRAATQSRRIGAQTHLGCARARR